MSPRAHTHGSPIDGRTQLEADYLSWRSMRERGLDERTRLWWSYWYWYCLGFERAGYWPPRSDDEITSVEQELWPRVRELCWTVAYGQRDDHWFDNDDLIQEALVRIYSAREQFDPSEGRFEKWVKAIITHCRADWRRRKKRYGDVVTSFDVNGPATSSAQDCGPSSVESAIAAELLDRLTGAINRLPADERAVVLATLSGSSIREFARQQEIPASTAQSCYDRALFTLSRLLDHPRNHDPSPWLTGLRHALRDAWNRWQAWWSEVRRPRDSATNLRACMALAKAEPRGGR